MILQWLRLRDIELEHTVNEVTYKVINLINMTHTKRHILEFKNSVVSGFYIPGLCLSLFVNLICVLLFLFSFQVF